MTATTRRTLVIGTSLLGPLAAFGGHGAHAASDAAEIDRDATRALQQLLREVHAVGRATELVGERMDRPPGRGLLEHERDEVRPPCPEDPRGPRDRVPGR